MNRPYRRTIRSISLGSAFKIGAILGLVSGLLSSLAILPFMGILASMASYGGGNSSGGILAGGLVSIILITIMGAIGGGIAGVINALVYNIVAGLVGGLEVEVA